MARHSHLVFISGVLLFVLLASLARPMAVYADDGTPPPAATEEPVQPPEEETATPPPATEESSPLPTDAPVVQESAATESPAVTESTPPPTQAPVVEEVAATEMPAAAEADTIGEVLEVAPEGTQVMVVDENGEALPLVSVEAAQIIQSGDPMWCPVIAGVPTLPGGAGCSPNFGTPQALIDNMDVTDPQTPGLGLYEQPGIIYFTADLTAPGNSFILIRGGLDDNVASPELYDADYDALKGYDLILQGGWSGVNGDTNFTQTDFGANPVQIGTGTNPWIGNITIKDITINGVTTGTGLTIYTQGNINLDNVAANDNLGEGADLDNCLWSWIDGGCAGSGGIEVNSSTFGDGPDADTIGNVGHGLWAHSGGAITFADVTADGNGGWGAYLTTAGGNGNITISSSAFGEDPTTGNGNDGLYVYSTGNINLDHVTANGNDFSGARLSISSSSGSINISSSTFGGGFTTGNGYEGLEVYSAGNITLTGVIAEGNVHSGADLDNCLPNQMTGECTGTGDVSITASHFDSNASAGTGGLPIPSAGLVVSSGGDVSLSSVTASNNLGGDGAEIFDFATLSIYGSFFNNNYSNESDGDFGYGWGLWAWGGFSGSGEVTLTNVTASGNYNPNFYAGGAWIDTSGNITIDPSEFNNNTSGAGLDLGAGGNITLTDVMANDNGDEGAWLFSDGDTTIVCSNFENNGAFGVDAWQVLGTLTLDRVTFSNNGAGDYDYDGSPAITSGACVVVVPPDEPVIPDTPVIPPNPEEVFETNGGHGHDALPLHIVPVDGGEEIKLECEGYSGTKLILPNGDQVTLPCPIHDHGVLTGKTTNQLPAPLNAPFVFASALEVKVIRGGKAVDKVNQGMTIDFVIPDGMQGKDFAILRWDAEKSQWVEVPGGTQTGDGRFLAASNLTGVYVLVTK